MKLFQRSDEEKRSIDDILTPKGVDEESVDGEGSGESCEVEDDAKNKCFEDVPMDLTSSALNCFGWDSSRTEKWMIKCVKVWYYIASFAWFAFGAITFAPVIFIKGKLKPILKDDLKALLASVAIYAVFFVLLMFLLFFNNGEGATEAASSMQ